MPPRVAGSISLLEAAPPEKAIGAALPAFGIAIRSEPSSVQAVRRVTRAWVRSQCQVPDDNVDAILMVISELCAKAVQHGRCPSIDVRGWMPAPDEVRFEVYDWSPAPVPQLHHVDHEAESGRGLLLVDLLITELGGSWGFSDDGTCAWCHLSLLREDR
ncbi:ATP-binding protein [Streptomyces sp. NPDC001508]|uniref:ATP-binding protein n=1 Tax=Streptomyces sp. NPDC001508 TaxID=3154656 RepID=UPI003317C6DB